MRKRKKKFIRIWMYIKTYLSFRKRIGFYGAFGSKNLGDESTLVSFNEFTGLNVLPMSKKLYVFNPHILKLLFIGGGGVFHWNAPYFPRRLLKRSEWDFPLVFLSAGINCDYGKEYSLQAVKKIKKLCEVAELITVRDKRSKNFLIDLGVKDKIKILPDLALVLSEKKVGPFFKKDSFTIGVSLATHTEFIRKNIRIFIPRFVKVINYLISKGYQIVFLPFQISKSDNIDDRRIFKYIIEGVENKERVIQINHQYKPQEMLYIIKKYCDFILGMRLHANVFAVNAGKPFISLSYNVKHKAFLEMMGLSEFDIPIMSFPSLGKFKAKFEVMMKNYGVIKTKIVTRRDYLKEDIKRQLRYIFNSFVE